MPIEYTPEQRETFGMRPDASFDLSNVRVESQATPPPVDDDGLPFMSHHELGAILGRSENNSKRLAWETGIDQHIEYRGQTGYHRVWFSPRDVQKHVESLRKGTHFSTKEMDPAEREMRWGQHDKNLKWTLKQAAAAKQSKVANNEPVFDTHNQPHRGNASFADHTYRGPRTITDSQGETSPTNSLKEAIRQGRFKSIKRGNYPRGGAV